MIRDWIAEEIELSKLRTQFLKLRMTSHSRDQLRRGYRNGYRTGRKHERHGLPDKMAPYRHNPHPQVETHGIEVDEGIRELLIALWQLGLDTQFSCQGTSEEFVPQFDFGRDHASQIVFATLEDATRFVRKSAELLDQSRLYAEGGLHLHTMSPIDGETVRAEVRFSPDLLREMTAAWQEFEASLADAP